MDITVKVTCKKCGCSFEIKQSISNKIDSDNPYYAECANCHASTSGDDYWRLYKALGEFKKVPDEITGYNDAKFKVEVVVPEKPKN